jgi:superfamily I DNA/RNA helicase
MLNVYFPESRARENKLIIQDSDDKFRQALHRSVIELRDNTRQNDHKFRSLPGNSLWISDIAGRKGGRLLYFKKNNQLIIWGLGPDHNIEDEPERYFNSKDYFNHKRHGRDRRLGKNQRLAIWEIYEKYLDLLNEKKRTTYPLMMLSMLQVIQKPDFEFKMDALFVDEIQDMTPVSIKIISALRKDKDALCILAGDFKQSIYRKSFRWDDVKLPFHGANVLTLKKNYRNTVQILDEAYRLTQHFKIKWVQPISCGRNGKPVERIVYQPENKISKICSLIQFAVTDQKIEYSDIAVFGASSKIENIVELLVKEDIPAVLIRTQDNHYQKNAVKVSTLHSAKGLEFRMVILIDIETELMNFRCDDEKLKDSIAVKLLYVGMTRAYDCLFFMLKENLNPQSKLDHFLYKIKQ